MSARRDAAKHLGFEFQRRYAALVEAANPEEVNMAAVLLGALFNENIEAVIWYLKEYGGVEQLPLERRPQPKKALPKTPDKLLN